MQRGFALLFVVLVMVAVLGLITVYFYIFQKPILVDNTKNLPQVNSDKKDNLTIYTNNNLNFQFKYQAKDVTVKEDTEEEFNQRGNGDFRKNFKGSVGYEPAKFLEAVVVLDKENNFDTNPFTVWIFENPQDLTIDRWHHDYWYYPFVWGDFTATGKFILAPKDEATISGHMAKSGVIDYQPGKPKFVYLAKDGKMYLFRIIGESGDKILQSFEFK
ncbi:hypothetical protein HYS96_01140 [Candidatus Daviesbacteria bacterium]|nr:hypothetical protein [Candidatus Daviesbacteria bacterium]